MTDQKFEDLKSFINWLQTDEGIEQLNLIQEHIDQIMQQLINDSKIPFESLHKRMTI